MQDVAKYGSREGWIPWANDPPTGEGRECKYCTQITFIKGLGKGG